MNLPLASVSLDLDNKWSYMKTHGNPGWEEFPSYLDLVVPRVLDYLVARDLTISFFVVGQDAALEKNMSALAQISAAGHEIGNHSFNHEPWLHLYSEAELDTELTLAEQAIEAATGRRPVGFRGPGFSLSPATLAVLAKRGYLYDATVFPNLLNPLARWYFFATSDLTAEEKDQRKELFGTWRDALRPVKPFSWELASGSLLEIPVTTMPLFKVPIHLSYIIYLNKFSRHLASLYLRFAILMCRVTGTQPSILLHPLDFMGREDDADLEFFPGMDMTVERKMAVVDEAMTLLQRHYRISTMQEHAESLRELDDLPVLQTQSIL